MSKKKISRYLKKEWDFENDPCFYEELALLEAQETIASLMKDKEVSKTELARRLGQSKSHITELLSEGRNLTLKTLGRICFFLGAELRFKPVSIEERSLAAAKSAYSFGKKEGHYHDALIENFNIASPFRNKEIKEIFSKLEEKNYSAVFNEIDQRNLFKAPVFQKKKGYTVKASLAA